MIMIFLKAFCLFFLCWILTSPHLSLAAEEEIFLSATNFGPVSTWRAQLDGIFPDPETKRFKLKINLGEFNGLGFEGVNSFLSKITSRCPAVEGRIASILLENGNSFRFNKIKGGLLELIEKNPGVKVEYIHIGKQSPAAPRRVLNSINGYELSFDEASGIFCLDPGESDGSSVISLKLFQDLTSTEEGLEKKESLERIKKSYVDLTGEDLIEVTGIVEKTQVLEVYSDDLGRYDASGSIAPVYLKVSGMCGYNMGDLVSFCRRTPSVKFISFVDSALSIEDIEPLLQLFTGEGINMVDVRNAFGAYDDEDVFPQLRKFLEKKEQGACLHNFLFSKLPVEESGSELATVQGKMRLLREYVELLEEA